jgi:hypothetical protein
MSRFLEDEQDDLLDGEEREEGDIEAEEEDAEEGYLGEEDTLEELDTDDRGHVRPRGRRSRFDEEIEPDYE